jgi:hypothetical protein
MKKCSFDENNLRIFERQILRKIFGPVNTDDVLRIRKNMEIYKSIKGADIVRFIKAQRIKCLGHIQRMDKARPTRKLLIWKPVGTRLVGRPRQRWQEDVMEDLKELKLKHWKETAKDRRIWRDLAERAETHKGLYCQIMMMMMCSLSSNKQNGITYVKITNLTKCRVPLMVFEKEWWFKNATKMGLEGE